MKLGISYNVFDDAIELLRRSIATVRNFAAHVSVVYQTTSNTGQPAQINILGLLQSLKEKGFIDEIILFEPNLLNTPAMNETAKRNAGLRAARAARCTYFMSMDSDEFYLKDELSYAINQMKNPNWDASVCRLVTYWKTSEFVLDPPETYFVPLIYKISKHDFQFTDFPVLVDPTRRILSQNVKIFEREEIQMHHLTAVRKDFRRKLENSSAIENFRKDIDNLVNYWTAWQFPQPALMPGRPPIHYNVKKVNDLFNVNFN